jgi:hypothetical protein
VTARALTLASAACVLASSVPVAAVQLEPEAPIGSLIKRKPKEVDPVRAGASVNAFARCTYGRKPDMVRKLLTHSDPVVVDRIEAEVSKIYSGPQTQIKECLGQEFDVDTAALELSVSPGRLRILLMEEDYLARNRGPIVADPTAPPPARNFVSTDVDLERAQAIARFSDCLVFRDATLADALLRTTPASDEERTAARALAPALGACLLQGEQMKLTPSAVRVYAVEGLWARFAGPRLAGDAL